MSNNSTIFYIMNKLIVIYFLMLSLNAYALDSKVSSESINQLKQGELVEDLDHSSQPKGEATRLSWKLGLSAHKDWLKKESSFFAVQVPALVELQFPIASSFEWLLQAGVGFRLELTKREICNPSFIPEKPTGNFAGEFFQKHYKKRLAKATNKETCRKKRYQNIGICLIL